MTPSERVEHLRLLRETYRSIVEDREEGRYSDDAMLASGPALERLHERAIQLKEIIGEQ